jgi:hypothetical protein
MNSSDYSKSRSFTAHRYVKIPFPTLALLRREANLFPKLALVRKVPTTLTRFDLWFPTLALLRKNRCDANLFPETKEERQVPNESE